MKTSSGSSLKAKSRKSTSADYGLPLTISLPALLYHKQSDRQFRKLVQDLLTLARRLETARDYFGHRINISGPQYHLLMTVAQLQGASGISIGAVAKAMQVSSSFVTAETGKMSDVGLLRKRPNPSDRRSALLKLAPLGRAKIHGLLGEIRAVNDLFFGPLTAQSFAGLCASAEALVRGSREAVQYIARMEEIPEN